MDGKERVGGQEMTAATMCVVMVRGRGVPSRSTGAFDGSRKYPHDQRQGGTMEVGAGRETDWVGEQVGVPC